MLLEEETQFITSYGSIFIQFPKFRYLRVGDYKGEPLKLPKYFLDRYVLIEVCRQVAKEVKITRQGDVLAILSQLNSDTTVARKSRILSI